MNRMMAIQVSTFVMCVAVQIGVVLQQNPESITPAPMPPRTQHVIEVRLVSATDGDTFVFEPVATQFTLRLANADTWESRRVRRSGSGPVTDEEIAKGKLAKERVEALLKSGRVFVTTEPDGLKPVRLDTFGRTLGRVEVFDQNGSRDVGQWLKDHGHVRN